MRRTVRWGVAAAAAAILVGGFVAPASAATGEGAGASPAGPEAPSAAMQIPDAPFNRTITADYHSKPNGDAAVIPASTTTLTLILPAESAAMRLDTVEWTMWGRESGATQTLAVDAATGTVTISVDSDFFAVTNAPFVDGAGQHYFTYTLRGTRLTGLPAPSISNGYGVRSAEAQLSIEGALYVGEADSDVVQTVDLARANAGSFSSTTSYLAQGLSGYWLGAGDTVSVSGAGLEWPEGTKALLEGGGDPSGSLDIVLNTAVGATSGSLELTVPGDADLSDFSDIDRSAIVSITTPLGDDARYVYARATIGFPTSIAGIEASRISSYNRYGTSAAIAYASYPQGAPTVFLATGDTFGDALSVAPVAALANSPVMLVSTDQSDYLNIVWGIQRLHPSRVVIVGGENSVSWEWGAGISYGGGNTPNVDVQRIAGADRYEVSRNIALQEFPGGAKTVFLASGLTFPDALSAVPSAVSQKAPVILVRGGDVSLDSQTTDLLQQLGATKVVIVGGPASVSTGIESQLNARYPSNVTRLGGADRFAVANAISRAYFTSAPTAYVATGLTFTDALTGGVMAGREHAPLLLSRTDCLPAAELDSLKHWKTSRVTLFGGSYSLNPSVMQLQSCG
ncbi:cell wall-binding repeat-containing protein [Herbiconiux sp. UC225_62]|uniref:cell wall-binding repeat-containing protein n=1 Tax=Herbiconiux sp. UC225_62 TaxID=3350168 RepID=UPI0036D3F703